MSLIYFELARSRDTTRELTSASVTLNWVAFRSIDEAAVYGGLVGPAGVAPLYRDGMRRGAVRLKNQGNGLWLCDVDYKWSSQTQDPTQDKDNPDKPLGPEWSFNAMATTTHITQSLKTLVRAGDPAFYPGPGNLPPDNQRAIGLTPDGVQGVDVQTWHVEGTLTVTLPTISPRYIGVVKNLTGKTNSKPFFSFPQGEVLYRGATINVQPDQAKVAHTFGFGESLGETQITDTLSVSVKPAWAYLWSGYVSQKVGGSVIQKAVAAYVERVYPEADLNALLS